MLWGQIGAIGKRESNCLSCRRNCGDIDYENQDGTGFVPGGRCVGRDGVAGGRTGDALRKLTADYRNAAEAADRAKVLRDFLGRYPETPYTAQLLRLAMRVIEHEMDDAEGMLELSESVLARVEGAELRREIMIIQAELNAILGETEKVKALATEIAAGGAVPFSVHAGLADALAESGDWAGALGHYRAALELATAEAIDADTPGYTPYPSEMDLYVRQRKTRSLTGIGWCQENMGEREAALESFAEAAKHAENDLFGAGEGDLNLRWGMTLLRAGDVEGAESKFAPGALTRGDEESLAELKGIYERKHDSAEGFDDYLWQLRMRLAVDVADFTLSDYDGAEHSFYSLRGEGATLLVFWHPT